MEIITLEASESAHIAAAPQAIYALPQDYHAGHASSLPSQYFTAYKVEKGSLGSGTIFVAAKKVMGNVSSNGHTIQMGATGRSLRCTRKGDTSLT